MSSRPVYERIIFNRAELSVKGYTFETDEDKAYMEHYVYKQDEKEKEKTLYDMFLYKNPGLKKILRYKLHSWGVQTLENIIKKEAEIKEKLKEKKEAIIEAKDKLVLETKDKFEKKMTEIKNKKDKFASGEENSKGK